MNRLQRLHDAGQSIWLDYIDRTMLHDGTLARRIADEALTGMTSNPTIFEKALAEGTAYDAQLTALPDGLSALEMFEQVAGQDVQHACDAFRAIYDRTDGADGYVSLEVSPTMANDADGTLVEARRLWALVDRPNLMIKVPGTAAGADATRRLVAEGINVNVTLLFSTDAYARVIDAYLSGLEDRLDAGGPIDRIASVASFFISRVDSEIDKRLDALAATRPEGERHRILALKGKAAIANAKLAYALFRERFSGARWQRLATAGARLQRPLWASTSTKNPAYRDVLYVEALVGPDTVNTMPPATVVAFADHGETRRTIDVDVEDARRLVRDLATAGISLDDATAQLLREGLASFQKSFDALIAGLERKRALLASAGAA